MVNNPKATVVIPTHKLESREGNVVSLLSSITKVCDSDLYQVVVIINNPVLARLFGVSNTKKYDVMPGTNIMTVNLFDNYGLSTAWNAAIEVAKGEYLMFISHDVILTEPNNIFEKMIALKETYEILEDDEVFVFGVEGTIQTVGKRVRIVNRYENGQFVKTLRVDEVSGFLFGIHSKYMTKNFFDDSLSPCFYEELDLCMRGREQKLSNIIIPGINYKHEFGISANNPRTTMLKWKTLDGIEMEESLWSINRRNKSHLEEKWGITIG